MVIRKSIFFALPFLFSGILLADQPLTYDRINLSVSAGTEVENDMLVCVMYAQAEGNDASQLSQEINRSSAARSNGRNVIP